MKTYRVRVTDGKVMEEFKITTDNVSDITYIIRRDFPGCWLVGYSFTKD